MGGCARVCRGMYTSVWMCMGMGRCACECECMCMCMCMCTSVWVCTPSCITAPQRLYNYPNIDMFVYYFNDFLMISIL